MEKQGGRRDFVDAAVERGGQHWDEDMEVGGTRADEYRDMECCLHACGKQKKHTRVYQKKRH